MKYGTLSMAIIGSLSWSPIGAADVSVTTGEESLGQVVSDYTFQGAGYTNAGYIGTYDIPMDQTANSAETNGIGVASGTIRVALSLTPNNGSVDVSGLINATGSADPGLSTTFSGSQYINITITDEPMYCVLTESTTSNIGASSFIHFVDQDLASPDFVPPDSALDGRGLFDSNSTDGQAGGNITSASGVLQPGLYWIQAALGTDFTPASDTAAGYSFDVQLQPMPEPKSAALLAGACGMLALRRRRGSFPYSPARRLMCDVPGDADNVL